MRLQDYEMLPDNFMGAAISQYEIGWDNIMEGWLARAWSNIQEQHLVEKNIAGQGLVGLQ